MFDGLTPGRYPVILADPPWSFLSWNGKTGAPTKRTEEPYRVTNTTTLVELPVADLAPKDAVLFMWVIDTHLEQALTLGNCWGFTYKTIGFWWDKERMGMGYYTRKEAEPCLLFTKGKPLERKDRGVRQVIREKAREHSRKPEETHRRIQRLFDGPYCELFARRRYPGWDAWGDEYGNAAERSTMTEMLNGLVHP